MERQTRDKMSLVSSKLSKHSSSSSVRSRRAKAAAKAACLQVEMDFLEREAEYKKLVMQKELAKARAEEETMCKIEEERQATEPQKRIGLRNSWTTYNNHESINQSMQIIESFLDTECHLGATRSPFITNPLCVDLVTSPFKIAHSCSGKWCNYTRQGSYTWIISHHRAIKLSPYKAVHGIKPQQETMTPSTKESTQNHSEEENDPEATENDEEPQRKRQKIIENQTKYNTGRPKPPSTQDKKIKNFTGKKTEGDQPFEDFIEELRTTFEAREMTSPEKVDFIMSHLDGPAKEEVRMYSKKERSNPDFLLDVLAQAFGEKGSSSQLLKMFYERKQKQNGTLRGYSYSLNELLKRTTKADPKAVPDPEKTLWDQFADNVRDPLLRKEPKKFIRERQPAFLDLREEALRWSEEEERPQRTLPRPQSSQEVAADIPDESSQCSASSTATPMDKVLEVLLKQQKSILEVTSSIRDIKQPRTDILPKEWRGRRPDIVCFNCNKKGHVARN
ncbi:hypothetical protein ACROYT_G019142 [Oculina patagonica]